MTENEKSDGAGVEAGKARRKRRGSTREFPEDVRRALDRATKAIEAGSFHYLDAEDVPWPARDDSGGEALAHDEVDFHGRRFRLERDESGRCVGAFSMSPGCRYLRRLSRDEKDQCLALVGSGFGRDKAARHLKVNIRVLRRECRLDPEFGDELETADRATLGVALGGIYEAAMDNRSPQYWEMYIKAKLRSEQMRREWAHRREELAMRRAESAAKIAAIGGLADPSRDARDAEQRVGRNVRQLIPDELEALDRLSAKVAASEPLSDEEAARWARLMIKLHETPPEPGEALRAIAAVGALDSALPGGAGPS